MRNWKLEMEIRKWMSGGGGVGCSVLAAKSDSFSSRLWLAVWSEVNH